MKTDIEIPEGVQLEVSKNKIRVSGPLGKTVREFPIRRLDVKVEGNIVKVVPKKTNALTKAILGTFRAHIENMIKGVQEKFVYKLKACSIHFPMTVKIEDKEVKISNFLGGKKPKIIHIKSDIDVKVSGDIIEVSSINKELAGSFAAKIEQSAKPKRKDRRIFQDGIYMIEKAGRKIE